MPPPRAAAFAPEPRLQWASDEPPERLATAKARGRREAGGVVKSLSLLSMAKFPKIEIAIYFKSARAGSTSAKINPKKMDDMARIQHDKPKNRISRPLPFLEIHIDSDGASHAFDPNSIAMISSSGEYPIGQPVNGLSSILSGKPAYLWREDDLEIPMTLEELDRFARLSLRPKEFKILNAHFGNFYHIHDDFYDPESGAAIQPRPKSSGLAHAKARILSQAEHLAIAQIAAAAPSKNRRQL